MGRGMVKFRVVVGVVGLEWNVSRMLFLNWCKVCWWLFFLCVEFCYVFDVFVLFDCVGCG